jgi:hypothetical protein
MDSSKCLCSNTSRVVWQTSVCAGTCFHIHGPCCFIYSEALLLSGFLSCYSLRVISSPRLHMLES